MPVKPFGFKHQVDIISQGGGMSRRDFFIDASMPMCMGRFLKGMLSTIATAIGKITTSTIWNFSHKRFHAREHCEARWDDPDARIPFVQGLDAPGSSQGMACVRRRASLA